MAAKKDPAKARTVGKRASTPKPIRVFIADDHKVVADGLSLYLDSMPEFEVLGVSASGKYALEQAVELDPDVLLLDVLMPDMDGLQVLEGVKRERPGMAVIMLTSHRDPAYLSKALNLGASGFLSKEIGLRLLPQAIRTILEGEAVVDKSLLQNMLQAPNNGAASGNGFPELGLTEQEFRVLVHIAEGLSNEDIAETLSISRNTVKTHVSRIYSKLGVTDRTQAAIWALRNGVIS